MFPAFQTVDLGPTPPALVTPSGLACFPAVDGDGERQREREREVDESGLPRPQLVGDAVTRQPPGRPLSARGQLSGGIIAVSDEIRLHAA